jgi:protein involved in polysaccharide export with SLBB domain
VKHNPFLRDGDVVRVPFEELAATIGGAVNRPGRYELVKTRDLAELVELAGGPSPDATQLLPISLVRRSADDRPDLQLVLFSEGARLPALALRPDDRVSMPSVSELQQSVVVVGAIAGAAPAGPATGLATAPEETSATKRLPFVKGDTVRTLLERVGGTGPLADLSGSYILRQGQAIPVDLYALVMLRKLEADRAVELGDTLVVPFKRRNVVVEGAVFAPGSYPYNPTFGVEQYLSLAGGRSRNAQSIDEVRVITSKGETHEYRPGLQVEPGSSLVVPERNFSRSEVVQIFLGVAGIVLSGVAVVIAAKK